MSEIDIPTTDLSGVPETIPSDLTVLDVREDHEWAAGHIAGATHIPLGELQARVGDLDPETRTIVVCHTGRRSAHATEWLHAQGHDVANLEGGMEAWEQAGRPITT